MNYIYPLTAIHRNGYTELLYSFDAVQKFIQKYGRFSDSHKSVYYDYNTGEMRFFYEDWVVRDDLGNIVNCKFFITNGYVKLRKKRLAKLKRYIKLGLPIPGTGCKKAGYKINHTAKKNSGSGHRNRNGALAIYNSKEYNHLGLIKQKIEGTPGFSGY